jgi:catalase
MTTTTVTYVLVRPNTSVEFLDNSSTNTEMQAFMAAYAALGLVDTITYSEDQLTKTRVQSYPTTLEPQLDTLYAQYADTFEAELARRSAAGITQTRSVVIQ